jgi:hypothetical protein
VSRTLQTPPFASAQQLPRCTVTVRCDGCRETVVGSTAEASTTTEAREDAERLAAREADDRGWKVGPGDAARCPRCRRRA